ncbi:MAG: AAA family ATPase [Euryarchaeota archaeon]|nr:AAA family ATPase [Euryarchaeota archaeon]
MRIIGVVSGKGGVGKTTTVTNLGISMAQEFNKRVLVVDGNLVAPNLGFHFGIYHYTRTLSDVLMRECNVEEAIQVHPSGVHVLPAVLTPLSVRAAAVHLERVLRGLGQYDVILVDTGPGVEREMFPVLEVSDEVIVVTSPDYPAVIDAKRTIEMAAQSHVVVKGVEVNRVRREKGELTPSDIQYVCETPVVGVVPERREVRRSIAAGIPLTQVAPRSPAAVEFRRLASLLLGVPYSAEFGDRLRNLFWFRQRAAIDRKLRQVSIPPAPKPREAPLPLEGGGVLADEVRRAPLPREPEVRIEYPATHRRAPEARREEGRAERRPEPEALIRVSPEPPAARDEEAPRREPEIRAPGPPATTPGLEATLAPIERLYKKGLLSETAYQHMKKQIEAKHPQGK